MIISKNTCLLDSNILVYAADSSSPFHSAAKLLREKGVKKELSLCVCPQVLLEFFAVITSPKRVVSPKNSDEAIKEVEKYFKSEEIAKIYPKEGDLEKIIGLLRKYKIKAQGIFDLQIVATMLSNNITKIYTYNLEHFNKFKEIEALTP